MWRTVVANRATSISGLTARIVKGVGGLAFGVEFLPCCDIDPLIVGSAYKRLNGRAKSDCVGSLDVPIERSE